MLILLQILCSGLEILSFENVINLDSQTNLNLMPCIILSKSPQNTRLFKQQTTAKLLPITVESISNPTTLRHLKKHASDLRRLQGRELADELQGTDLPCEGIKFDMARMVQTSSFKQVYCRSRSKMPFVELVVTVTRVQHPAVLVVF